MTDQYKEFRDQLYRGVPFDYFESKPETVEQEFKDELRKKYKELKSKSLADASEKLPVELIEGILYQGRRMLIASTSFGRKSWFCIYLAFCLSKGLPVLGRFKTVKIPVLYVNFELLEASVKIRFKAIAKALNYAGDPYENLRIISTSEYMDLVGDDFVDFLVLQASEDKVKTSIIDPLWRLLGSHDENSNSQMGQLLKPFAKFSREASAGVIGSHHFAKGNASAKEALDRFSGAGALARDAATLLIVSPHKVADAYTIDLYTNDFPKIDKFVIQFIYPLFELAPDLDPNELKTPPDKKESLKKKTDQQADQIFSVLYATDQEGGLCASEITRFTKIPKKSVYRLLKDHCAPNGRLIRAGTKQMNGQSADVYQLSAWYRIQCDHENDEQEGNNGS